MIVIFTDFGLEGLYTGQVKARIYAEAPETPVFDLFSDAPRYNPEAASYLLAAYAPAFPAGAVMLCVVDPGVGGERAALAISADGKWFVGPDNGLFEMVIRRSGSAVRVWNITWLPDGLSNSFHGRDLFAPVAVRISRGESAPGDELDPLSVRRKEWPDDLAEIIYIDRYGNGITGIRGNSLNSTINLAVNGVYLKHAEVFSRVSRGNVFWYENANGQIEIAANQASAVDILGLQIGTAVTVIN